MPNSRMGGSEWHRVKGLLGLVLLGLLGSCGHSSQQKGANEVGPKVDSLAQQVHVLDSLVQVINKYLGTNQGENPSAWTGLTGNIRQNNEQLRNVLKQMSCDIYKLQHPGQECPPGGPGTVPSQPPNYPP